MVWSFRVIGIARRVRRERCQVDVWSPQGGFRFSRRSFYDEAMNSPRAAHRRPVWPIVVILLLIGAALAIGLSGLSTAQALVLLGIPDPGVLTTAGLPAMRVIGELLCAVAVGTALFAAFFTPQARDGTLDVAGYRAQNMSSWANVAWAASAALLVSLTLSDVSGKPLSTTLPPDQWLLAVEQIEVASSWRWAALLALIAGIGQRFTVSWRWSVVWLAITVLSLLPVAATGHAAGAVAHDIATNSLILHLLAAAVWVGGLIAVLVHTWRGGRKVALALRRFSVVATVAIVVMAVSGIVNLFIRLRLTDLLTSTYGLLIVAKLFALALLGLCGLAVRRRIIADLDTRDPDAPLRRRDLLLITGIEAAVMAATMAVAVSLGRTPPPVPRYLPSIHESLIGLQLPGPLSMATIFGQWRFDLLLGTVAIVALVLYLWGLRRLHKRDIAWPAGRTISWAIGCVILFLTTSSGFGMYARAEFSAHMTAHVLLSILVPIFLVMGGPMTLALHTLPAAGRTDPPGPREWLVEFINNPISRFLTHPVVVAVQFVAGFYVVYLGRFYDELISEHFGLMFMNVYFLVSGCLFFWVLIGVDATPKPYGTGTKLLVLLGALPLHILCGLALFNSETVLAEMWYGDLNLAWITTLLHDQQVGGGTAWAAGVVVLVLVLVAVGFQWQSSRRHMRGRTRSAALDEASAPHADEAMQ